jgi:hypothetical protein
MATQPSHGGGHDNPMDSFKLVAAPERKLALIQGRAKAAVKQHYKSVQDLARSIEAQGTPVHLLGGGLAGKLVLFLLGYEPGFIPRVNSKRYRLLLKVLQTLDPKPDCTDWYGLFVLTKPLFTVGFLSHQLHHWQAFRAGMAGYDVKDQAIYRQFWEKHNGILTEQTVERMSVEEIVRLKNAINRDMEALKFVREVTLEIFNPATQAGKLADGSASA